MTPKVLTLAQGKRETSTLIGIGTLGPDPHDNVLADLRQYATEHPDDPTFVWREVSADAFTDHPVDRPLLGARQPRTMTSSTAMR